MIIHAAKPNVLKVIRAVMKPAPALSARVAGRILSAPDVVEDPNLFPVPADGSPVEDPPVAFVKGGGAEIIRDD